MREDGDLFGGVLIVTVGCPSEGDAAKGGIESRSLEERNEGTERMRAFRDIGWEDGGK